MLVTALENTCWLSPGMLLKQWDYMLQFIPSLGLAAAILGLSLLLVSLA
jgi:hypothetical protein